jgi:hypothetical protein
MLQEKYRALVGADVAGLDPIEVDTFTDTPNGMLCTHACAQHPIGRHCVDPFVHSWSACLMLGCCMSGACNERRCCIVPCVGSGWCGPKVDSAGGRVS